MNQTISSHEAVLTILQTTQPTKIVPTAQTRECLSPRGIERVTQHSGLPFMGIDSSGQTQHRQLRKGSALEGLSAEVSPTVLEAKNTETDFLTSFAG
jgi:hypothetical protein